MALLLATVEILPQFIANQIYLFLDWSTGGNLNPMESEA